MGTVKIKNKDQGLVIRFSKEFSFSEQLEETVQRLRQLQGDSLQPVEVFFEFSSIPNQTELIACFQSMKPLSVLVQGMQAAAFNQPMHILKTPLYGGQEYRFEGDLLCIQDIPKDTSLIMVSGDAYILGEVRGRVELIPKEAVLHASSFMDARIKICDSDWAILTNSARSKVYYENRTVVLKQE